MTNDTPAGAGFSFPAEWHPHAATWLSWPHTEASWTKERQALMLPAYLEFIKAIAQGEQVCINAHNETVMQTITMHLQLAGADMSRITLLPFPTNDSWCRDHGPAFLLNPVRKQRMVVNWGYNAWGGKYPPFDRDDLIPVQIAHYRGLDCVTPGIVMEGGSVEFNGAGTVLTSRACLLNKNRNPNLSQSRIERYLCDFYGVQQVLWVEDGIVGDDTDGHIDDTVRFVNEDTVLAASEVNTADANYPILQDIHRDLRQMRLLSGKPLTIIDLPMPDPVYSDGLRLPASYANFYIANAAVLVPTFRCAKDQQALDIIGGCFADRPVVGIDSTDIVWGLGSFHCLSQQGAGVMMYDNKTFRSVSNTANGEVSGETVFHYQQRGSVVWAEYAGGSIARGFLLATVQPDNSLDMRYQHVNRAGELMTGRCHSTPEVRPDGRLRLHERWQWTSGDGSAGESIIDEVAD